MEHTPGPWRVSGKSFGGGLNIRDSSLKDDLVAEVFRSNKQEGKDYAHLIAAAPDLLEVCKTIFNSGRKIGLGWTGMLYKAIAKAEGKEGKL